VKLRSRSRVRPNAAFAADSPLRFAQGLAADAPPVKSQKAHSR
jgi:hypothetical protein